MNQAPKNKHVTPGRVVAFLGPTTFAPAAGFISLYVAKHFPGAANHLTAETVAGAMSQAAIFIAGLVIAHLKASKWLDGWQKWESDQTLLNSGALPPTAIEEPVAAVEGAGPEELAVDEDADDEAAEWDESVNYDPAQDEDEEYVASGGGPSGNTGAN